MMLVMLATFYGQGFRNLIQIAAVKTYYIAEQIRLSVNHLLAEPCTGKLFRLYIHGDTGVADTGIINHGADHHGEERHILVHQLFAYTQREYR